MASEIKVDTISEKTSANGVTIDSLSIKDGGLVAAGNIDVNGNNLVLDANANTYLDAGTDDTIKVYVSGAEDLRIAANAINVLSGTTLTIDSGATIANSGTATGFSSADPSSADGDTLGTASAEWSDLYLADGGVIYFGNDQEIPLTHNADDGLLLKHVGTGDGKEPSLTFQAGDNDIAQDDVLGSIFFQAPDEGAGTDAILVAAGIEAVSEGDFSSSNNATKLSFKTAASEAAAEKMSLSSGGNLDVTGDITGSTINADGDTSSGDNAAIGYTAGEGLILTGQGSTSDVTLKNDADGTVFTVPTGTDDILFPDNAKAIWGAGSDLSIYHDGSDSFISDQGTGNLTLLCGNFEAKNAAGDEDMIKADADGAVELYYNNGLSITTVAEGLHFGSVGGADAGFKIYRNATRQITFVGSDNSSNCTTNMTGDLAVSGAVSKGSGSFKIKHPLEAKKNTHYLVHSFIEGPKADLIYRGKVTLSSGTATVNIDTVSGMTDGTFVALCDDTQCFTTNESDWDAVKGSLSGNTLTINCENASSTATISWLVIGDRKDEHIIDSETGWTDGSGKPIIEPLQSG